MDLVMAQTYMAMVEEVKSKVLELGADWDARKVEQAVFADSVVEKHGFQEEFRQFLSQKLENGGDDDGDNDKAPPPANDNDKTPPPDDEEDDAETLSPPSPPAKKKRKKAMTEGETRKSARLGEKASESAT